MNQSKRAAIYARVSTDGQTAENQRRELQAAIERDGATDTDSCYPARTKTLTAIVGATTCAEGPVRLTGHISPLIRRVTSPLLQ